MTDTDRTDLPAWLTEGAKVAIFNAGRGHGAGHATFTTVTKIQKLHVLTEDSKKFRRSNLNSIAHRNAFDSTDVLCASDDHRVVAALKAHATRDVTLQLSNVIYKNKLHGDNPQALLSQVEAIRDAATEAHAQLLHIIES